MNKKNLDKLFLEKFKDFSEVPDEKIWENIAASLDKKKRRRAIPIWWKLGGIAAVLAVLISVINPFADSATEKPIVTDVEKSEDKVTPRSGDEVEKVLEMQKTEESVVNSETKNAALENNAKNDNLDQNGTPNNSENKKNNEGKDPIAKKQEPAVARYESKNNLTKREDVAENNTTKQVAQKKKDAVVVLEKNENLSDTQGKKDAIAQTNNDKSLEKNLKVGQNDGVAQTEKEVSQETAEKDSKKKSIFDEIENQDDVEIAANKTERWSVGANVAPVYFNAIGEGSPIHPNFVPNSKSGEINMSYGLSVSYALGEKLSIRSGINKVDYGYDTNEIEFRTASLAVSNALTDNSQGQIANINYTERSNNLIVSSSIGSTKMPQNNEFLASDAAGKSTAITRNGVMAQQFGYVEVPVELDYALIDNRFGVNLIGGVSSLFLVDNSVAVTSGELTNELGEANNLNSVNFSGNIGFGVNYKFTSKVQINIEPVFKYQLNTFSNTEGTFQPFSVGIYSGLSFKF